MPKGANQPRLATSSAFEVSIDRELGVDWRHAAEINCQTRCSSRRPIRRRHASKDLVEDHRNRAAICWAICDTVCCNLLDRTPTAWKVVDKWAGSKSEFEKRAAFALLWSLALHDKAAHDAQFIHGLELVAREAMDDRNFVTKAMAMRAVGRRNDVLAQARVDLVVRLQSADDRSSQLLGRTAFKELTASKA